MKIQFASDLHLEFLEQRFAHNRVVEPCDADVLVIAGDIHRDIQAIAAFADWPVPVIYVHGNHEAYKQDYTTLVDALGTAAADTNVHYLERSQYVLNGVRFLGCCLWTDYRLYGEQVAAMEAAERELNDHRMIRSGVRFFSAEDALNLHRQARAWLEKALAEPHAGATVVVTHHGPHINSVHAKYEGSILNAAFMSDLGTLMGPAVLWVHGHVHDSFDYVVNGTRVVANPRGYPLNRHTAESLADIEWENPAFNPRCVVEV